MGTNGTVKLFAPSGRDMKVEYPELNECEEFVKLHSKELKFVWLYSNRTSPFYNVKQTKNRIVYCIKESFGESLKQDEYKRYMSGVFPEHIRMAIDRMEKFSPSIRLRAKLNIEKIFSNLEKISDISSEEILDLQAKKDYATLAIMVAKNMPDIVKQYEDSYGIKYTEKIGDNQKKGPTLMDKLHMEDE